MVDPHPDPAASTRTRATALARWLRGPRAAGLRAQRDAALAEAGALRAAAARAAHQYATQLEAVRCDLDRLRGVAGRLSVEADSLRHEAVTDPMTGVGNRRALDAALARLVVGGVVVVLDIDHFKRFNDRYGHLAGDAVLRTFARTLADVVRAGDTVCRFGGEEFVIVVGEPADAADLFVRLRTAWEAGSPPVTFSAGLAARRPGEEGSATLGRADAALYEAKAAGRDRQAAAPPVPTRA